MKDVCKRKRSYRDRQEAYSAARIVRRRSGKPLRAYHCPHCEKWHLTSEVG